MSSEGFISRPALTAIGVGANNGWWHIAWDVMEKEAKEPWKWFLVFLNQDLDLENEWKFTFKSNQQNVNLL